MNRSIYKFDLPGIKPPVPVTLPFASAQSCSSSSPHLTKDHLLSFPAFKNWIQTLQQSLSLQLSDSQHPFHTDPYVLRSIEIQAADFFRGEKLGFLKLRAEITNNNGERIPGSVLLRGGSVGMLIVLKLEDSEESYNDIDSSERDFVIFTVQPRIPAGSLSFIELPAGMLDEDNPSAVSPLSCSGKESRDDNPKTRTFSGSAAREIAEETGLTVTSDQLICMTDLILESSTSTPSSKSSSSPEHLNQAMYPSPGGSDEYIPLFLHQRRVSSAQLKEWQGRLTGLRNLGEKITVKIVPLKEAWIIGGRDAKVLAALGLYWKLKYEGKI